MEFRVLFFHILRSISLVSWYLESPHVARIGQRLANCPYPTLACIEASQNALRNYQQTLALRAECERQNRLDQLYQNELREVQDKKYQAELVKNATLWKTKGEAPPVFIDQRTYIDNSQNLQFNNFCPNDINPALFFKNLERNCDNLHKLNQLDPGTKEVWLRAAEAATLSGKQIPPVLAIDAPDSESAHHEWKYWFHAIFGVSPGTVGAYIVTSYKGFLELLCIFLIIAWLIRWIFSKLRHLMVWLFYKTLRLMVPLFFKPAKSVHDQSAQTDELIQSDQPAQSEQDVEQDQSAELDDPTQPPVTTVRTFELRRLRREADGNTARANATRMLRQRIEEMMQEDLLGEWFTHEMPLRPANAEAVRRLRQAVDQQQRNLAARRRVDLEEEDEL